MQYQLRTGDLGKGFDERCQMADKTASIAATTALACVVKLSTDRRSCLAGKGAAKGWPGLGEGLSGLCHQALSSPIRYGNAAGLAMAQQPDALVADAALAHRIAQVAGWLVKGFLGQHEGAQCTAMDGLASRSSMI